MTPEDKKKFSAALDAAVTGKGAAIGAAIIDHIHIAETVSPQKVKQIKEGLKGLAESITKLNDTIKETRVLYEENGYLPYLETVERELESLPEQESGELPAYMEYDILSQYIEEHAPPAHTDQLPPAELQRLIDYTQAAIKLQRAAYMPSKTKITKLQRRRAAVELVPISADAWETVPVSSMTHLVEGTLIATGRGKEYEANKNIKVTRAQTPKEPDKTRTTSIRKDKGYNHELFIDIPNDMINGKGKNSPNLVNMFRLCMQAENKQKANIVSFTLQNLVDLGFYTTIESARNGFKDLLKTLHKIEIGGREEIGKKIISQPIGTLFTAYDIVNNTCLVELSQIIMDFIKDHFYTIAPNSRYSLPTNASHLMTYITTRARQLVKDIKATSGFNVSFESIRNYLSLPKPKETQRHAQQIIEPLLMAIDEVEADIQRQKKGWSFTPTYNTNYKNIREFLAGYLRIDLTPEAAAYFIKIADDNNKQIKTAQNAAKK